MLTPYNYAASSPVVALDKTGKDYDLIIDDDAKTLTIAATYYATDTDAKFVQNAANELNNRTGDTYELNGEVYSVKLALEVQVVPDPVAALRQSASEFTGDGKAKTPMTNTNSVTVQDDNHEDLAGKPGRTKVGRLTSIADSYKESFSVMGARVTPYSWC